MLTKEKLKTAIDKLPENFTIEEAVEQIVLVYKIEQGLQDAEKGKVFPTGDMAKNLKK